MKKLYEPKDELEAEVIKRILAENSIESLVQSYRDSAYSGIFQAQKGWGTIGVYSDDYQAASCLISEWISEEIEREEDESKGCDLKKGTNKKMSIKYNAAIATSLIFNIIFIIIHLMGYSDARKNFDLYDSTGSLSYKVEWGENKRVAYKTISYLRNGDVSSVAIDENDNGRIDKYIEIFFSSRAIYFDKDNDGVFEKCEILYTEGARVDKYDSDQNGIFERSIITVPDSASYEIKQSNINGYILSISTLDGNKLNLNLLPEIMSKLK